MSNELYEHKRSDTIKWVLTLLAFILVGVMLAGIICGWFDKKDEPAEEEQTEQEGGMEITDGTSANGISLMSASIAAADYEAYGVSALAESAQMVTAYITPSDALNQEVDWSVAWKNPSSAWAKGKDVTDYVTITPTSDGALTATVECIEAFGEQVLVTATSRDNPSAKGSCTANYMQRYLGTETSLSFNNSQYYQIGEVATFTDKTGTANMPNKAESGSNTNTLYSPKNPVVYTSILSETYTLPLEGEDISYKYYLKLNPEFVTALDDASTYFTTSSLAADWELFDETSGTLSADDDVSSAQTYTVIDYYHVLCSELRTAVGPNVWYFNPSTLNPFIRAAKEIDDYHFEVKVVAEAGGQSYETVSRMKFNASSLNIAVTNVSVSSDIVF